MAPAALPAYTRLRIGAANEIPLIRSLTPPEAIALARAARARGLRVTLLTSPVEYGPGRAAAARLSIGPSRPMSSWQRQRAALFERPECIPNDVQRLRAALARLARQHGVDAIRNALRREVTR